MKPINVTWPQTEQNRSIMFVAQLLQSMTSPESYESFRSFSLDSSARLWEYQEISNDVLRGRIPIATLDPVLEELEWSLSRDKVAQSIAPNQIEGFIKAAKGATKLDLTKMIFHARYLFEIIHNAYRDAAQSEIVRLAGTKNRNDLRAVVSNYCASLINAGLSRSHLLHHVNSIFFSSDHYRLGTPSLTRFFREIGFGTAKFDVYYAFDRNIATHLKAKIEASIFSERSLSPSIRADIKRMSTYNVEKYYISIEIEEYDPYEAARRADTYLANFLAITYLGRRGIDFSWSKEKYVVRGRSKSGHIVINEPIIFQKKGSPSGKIFKSFRSQINLIYGCFQQSSIERITSSINTSALAVTSTSLESQIISLWSAFEVLLSEPSGEARVVHYVKLLVPCIAAKYARRYIIAICDELSIGYGTRFKKIMDRLPVELGIDRYTRFTYLMFDKTHQVFRDQLFTLCAENPLACNRLYKLCNDFSSPQALIRSIEAYERRVEWQLYRIYRARNSLVHAGKMPNYLESLVQNAFEYYKSTIGYILWRARGMNERDVDSVVIEVAVQFDDLKRSISKISEPTIPTSSFADCYR